MAAHADTIDWHCLVDAAAVAVRASEIILQAAQQAIATRGVFKLVLAGGGTPSQAYAQLAGAAADWPKWQLYFGDERCLPVGHADRNSQMASEAWLANGAIPGENIHAIPAERGAATAARDYAALVDAALPFDLVLLGIGEDGHTASLFPGDTHVDTESVHAVHNAPKPPPERVSLSRASLSNSRQVLVLVSGTAKHTALQAWRTGEALPIAGITAIERLQVLYDTAAAGQPC